MGNRVPMEGDAGINPPSDVQTAARQLAMSAATAEIVQALRPLGIRAILLKGAVIADRLYDDAVERPYLDIDLLPEPGSLSIVEGTLRALGFADMLEGVRPRERARHATPWRREDWSGTIVDLHTSLYWCSCDPATVWDELSRDTQTLELAGTHVEVLGDASLALVIAAHAVQHGASSKPLEDLERALERIDRAAWADAGEKAARLGATAAFTAGLLRTAEGAKLANELGLDDDRSPEMQLRISGAPPVSVGIMRLFEADGLRERIGLIVEELVPSPAWMRLNTPLARRGRAGLALAYASRPFLLASQVLPALRAYRVASAAQRPKPQRGGTVGAMAPNGRPDPDPPAGLGGDPEPERVKSS